MKTIVCVQLWSVLLWLCCVGTDAAQYTNFNVAIYVPVSVVRRFEDPNALERQWNLISNQLKVDKVYIEVQRDRTLASDELIERVKQFFLNNGIKAAGGMALSDGSVGGQFKSFCYTDPADRAFVRNAVELAARHFDEVIQDDFFFVTTKYESDIAAKGNRSWTEFRLKLMREAAEELILKPARAIKPALKMIIKYPNWYEHFQGLGYDLEVQPHMFDAIYTGTETRDPELTDQNLQEYESYLIFRYLENIAPGRNLGGWVDTYSIRHIDRYAEQVWCTMFAKAPEITLFEWSALTRPVNLGERSAWAELPTSFNRQKWLEFCRRKNPNATDEPTYASVAGFCLEQIDAVVGNLGRPIGIKSYKPFHSWGEDFLHNYLGNIGIPIDLCPYFPTNANVVLLTECASFDPDIIPKIKMQLTAGKTVIVTSGLLRALQGRGIEDILEVEYTDRKVLARGYVAGFGAGTGTVIADDQAQPILITDIRFLTNDAWPVIRALANGRGYPLLLMDRYAKGVLYIWTIPDNFNDLYLLPVQVLSAIKDHVMKTFSVRVDGPSHVALFAYDNNTFVLQSFRDDVAQVRVGLLGKFSRLQNLLTDELVAHSSATEPAGRAGSVQQEQRTWFDVTLMPHSYVAFLARQ